MTLAERVGRLEATVGDPGQEADANLVAVCAELTLQLSSLQRRHADLLEAHERLIQDLEHRQMQQQKSDLAMEERLETRLRALEDEVILLRRAARDSPSTSVVGIAGPKARVPEPKPFGGARSAKDVENFLWDMEVYLRAARIPEADQVDRASMFLEGDAKLWWRTRGAEDANAVILCPVPLRE